MRLEICAISAVIIKYNSIIQKKRKKKHEKIVLLEKSKLNTKEILLSKTLIDVNNSHDKLIAVNDVLKEYNDMKEAIEN